jgi:tRNA threonylcarbamoyladenosine biosynthesis protein TsaB
MYLGIETSSKNCSVALWDSMGNVWSNEKESDAFVHAEQLHQMIEELLAQAGVTLKQLERVVVGRGPGSYTGLRIGVSCAKGIAYSLGIPLYSISTLVLMGIAKNVLTTPQDVLLVMDARRNEVYGSWFRDGVISEPAAIIFEEGTLNVESNQVFIVGENATKLIPFLREGDIAVDVLPSAVWMANSSAEEFMLNEDVAYFEPQYVKPFVPTLSKK